MLNYNDNIIYNMHAVISYIMHVKWYVLLLAANAFNSAIMSATKFNEVYANRYARSFLLRVRSTTANTQTWEFLSSVSDAFSSLSLSLFIRNFYAFTHIIGLHNFPNLFDKILIGRPRFRPEFPGPSWNTHRWKRNVAPLTSANAERMEVGPTKRQELIEYLLPRTPLPLL